jgi:hypothetical protein
MASLQVQRTPCVVYCCNFHVSTHACAWCKSAMSLSISVQNIVFIAYEMELGFVCGRKSEVVDTI